MRFQLLISFLMNIKVIHSISRPDDMFSSGLSEPDSDSDLFESEEPNPLESNFNDLAGSPDMFIFSPSDDVAASDPLVVHPDAYTPSENLLVADVSVGL